MTRSVSSIALVLVVLAASAAGCGGDPAPAPTPGATPDAVAPTASGARPTTGPGGDEAAPPLRETPLDFDKAREDQLAWREEMDRYGRGLLESFRARVYDPSRDGGLRFVEGVATARSGGVTGSFPFTFDAGRPADARVVIAEGAGADALPAGAAKQVAQFAAVSMDGAYRPVVHYLPPSQLLVTKSRDGEHRVVTAQPHTDELSVSYSVDAQDLIQIRGTSVPPAAEIAYYDWTFTRGRYLLEKQWLHGSEAVVEYEYDDRRTNGVVLLQRAIVRKGESAFDVSFRYDRVETDR